MSKNKQTAVIGLGYVGLPLALLIERKGIPVVGIDSDANKIALINNKKSPFLDAKIEEELQEANNLVATTDYGVLKDVDTIIVCVPTPVDENHTPDLGPVISVCTQIAKYLTGGKLVIIESTINPGVCEELIIPLLEKLSKNKCGKDFYLAHCPERINPGDDLWDVSNIPRVVGGYDEVSLEKAHAFYTSIISAPIKKMSSLKEAEAVKIVENSFRDVNIAFVNELAMSFHKLGINVVNVIDGAATKPFAFLPHYPGAGVGGHCIPVDPYYLIDYAEKNGFTHEFLSLARSINNGMPQFTVDVLAEELARLGIPLADANILVLGLSYKANIGDMRESPSLEIIKILKERAGKTHVFDPHVPELSTVASLDEALEAGGVHAIILATSHKEFQKIDPVDLKKYGVQVVIDGRNYFKKKAFIEAGIAYKGIGR